MPATCAVHGRASIARFGQVTQLQGSIDSGDYCKSAAAEGIRPRVPARRSHEVLKDGWELERREWARCGRASIEHLNTGDDRDVKMDVHGIDRGVW